MKKASFKNPSYFLLPKSLLIFSCTYSFAVFLSVCLQAVRAFSKAVHLNPTVQELWKEDLQWACTLLEQKKHITAELEESTLTNNATIKELDTESRTDDAEEYIEDVVSQDKDSDDENALADDKYDTYRQQKMVSLRNSDQSLTPKTETVKAHEELSPPHQTSQVKKTVKSLPTNYVLMR